MADRLRWLLVLCPLLVGSGCAMCCAPYDDYYPAVGGRWIRDNPTEGRVGSAFAPAGHRVEDAAPQDQPQSAGEPQSAPLPATLPHRDGASFLPLDG
ncbi:MAG: hypothetical protein MUF06_14015 [Pirellulaceae bacterium]|jgi:hypothetical protein|nr:hypothetical protein [Pirellulaceae bacterium]